MRKYNLHYLLITAITAILYLIPAVSAAQDVPNAADGDFVVVIDPGHGGKDYGAIGRITNEKTINLDVARRLNKLLQQHKDIKTVMTRTGDTFISLQERAEIANKAHGNLFISIHVNSLARRARNRNTIAGASVYTLGLHRSSENLDVAMRENAVISLEPDHTAKYMGFDPESSESYIIFELNQNIHLDQSINFAQLVQDQLVNTASRQDRGVRQAGFWVLMATAMPAVLVELDFICNPQMERYLNSSKGKDKLALSIYKAICNYRGVEQTETAIPETPEESDTETDNNTVSQPDDNQPSAQTGDSEVSYKIQILASDTPISKKSSQFKGRKDVTFYKENGLYKYTVGSYSSMPEAQAALRKIKSKFPQAFIIKWRGNKRVH